MPVLWWSSLLWLPLLLLALIVFTTPAQAPAQFMLMSAESVPLHYEERLVKLDREAIEEAYQRQVRQLFLNWMKDEAGQPARAVKGIERARRAYMNSINDIERREKLVKLPGGGP